MSRMRTMSEAERIVAAAACAGVALTGARALAAAPLIRAMTEADRILRAMKLTEPPSGPHAAP